MLNDLYFKTYPSLESDRLVLRAIEISDAKDINEIRSNDEVMTFMDSSAHQSIGDSEKFIQQGIDTYKKGQGFFWAIIDKSTGIMIGDFSFWKIDLKNHRAEIGYTLKPKYWGIGVMSETMKMLLDFGFNQLNLHSFEANINPKNNGSRQLLLKSGFVKEAYFKENYYFNGQYLDSEIYSLIKSEHLTNKS